MILNVSVFDSAVVIRSRRNLEGIWGRFHMRVTPGEDFADVPFEQLRNISSGWYDSPEAIVEEARRIAAENDDSTDSSGP